MEKEFAFDQEVVKVRVVEEDLPEELVEDYQLDDEDYASTDEGEIDWSTL